MDDNKVIPMMEAFFKKQAETVDENDDKAKKQLSFSLRKPLMRFLEWYEETRKDKTVDVVDEVETEVDGKKTVKKVHRKVVEKWETGSDAKTQFPTFQKLPSTTGDKALEKYEAEIIPILEDFNQRNIGASYIEEYFDSYLEIWIKYGHKKRMEELREKSNH